MGAERLNTEIKRLIREYLENEKLSDLVYGTYTGSGLKIDNKPVEISLDMVNIPMHLQTIEGTLSFTVTKDDLNSDGERILEADPEIESITIKKLPVTLQTGLSPGEKVAVVQQRGSQRYSIIDRV